MFVHAVFASFNVLPELLHHEEKAKFFCFMLLSTTGTYRCYALHRGPGQGCSLESYMASYQVALAGTTHKSSLKRDPVSS